MHPAEPNSPTSDYKTNHTLSRWFQQSATPKQRNHGAHHDVLRCVLLNRVLLVQAYTLALTSWGAEKQYHSCRDDHLTNVLVFWRCHCVCVVQELGELRLPLAAWH